MSKTISEVKQETPMFITKEMMEKFNSPLTVQEITWMIQFGGKSAPVGKTRVIPYITGRCANDRLRECFGVGLYQTKFREVGKIEAGYICTLSLLFETGWCSFEDGASCTKIEPNKGGISSSLKRVVNSLGLGRELYDFPVVHIKGTNLQSIPYEFYPMLEELTKDLLSGKESKSYYLLGAEEESPKTNVSSTGAKPVFNPMVPKK